MHIAYFQSHHGLCYLNKITFVLNTHTWRKIKRKIKYFCIDLCRHVATGTAAFQGEWTQAQPTIFGPISLSCLLLPFFNLPFPFFPFLQFLHPSLPLCARNCPPYPARRSGSTVRFPSGVPGGALVIKEKHVWYILSHEKEMCLVVTIWLLCRTTLCDGTC